VFLGWSRDGQVSATTGGWLEAARRSSFTGLTRSGQEGATADTVPAGQRRAEGTIDDDEHLAAYNAFLARINAAEPQRSDRTAE
jgi:hypothetical protein